MKKTKLIPVACLAALLTLLLLIPAVVMPTAAATTVTVYANSNFENLSAAVVLTPARALVPRVLLLQKL